MTSANGWSGFKEPPKITDPLKTQDRKKYNCYIFLSYKIKNIVENGINKNTFMSLYVFRLYPVSLCWFRH